MITGIVLAAGASSRMKQNKMCLPFRGTILLEHTIKGLLTVCQRVIIVRGHYKDDYLDLMNFDDRIEMVDNNLYKQGMFSSVRRGVLEAGKSDVLIIPGDYPLVKGSTYKQLVEGQGEIRVPVYNGKRGHPLFIHHGLLDDLLKQPETTSLKEFRNYYEIEHIMVDDAGVLFDVDDMLEYQKLLDMERME
jgi:molybdenum cofactor cytidylyltransferase